MPGFLYYAPGAAGFGPEVVKQIHAWADSSQSAERVAVTNGPDKTDDKPGRGGVVGAFRPETPAGEPANPIGYYPDRQEWRVAPGGAYWVGYNLDAPPRPADLARRDVLPHYTLTLGDGQDWEVPIAREGVAGSPLPHILDMDDELRVIRIPDPRFATFAKQADKFWGFMCDVAASASEQIAAVMAQVPHDRVDSYGDEDFWALATTALGLLYRVSNAEVRLLRPFNQTNLWEIAKAVVDWPGAEAMEAEAGADPRVADAGDGAPDG